MNRNEFTGKYSEFAKIALASAFKARGEGLLSLEDELNREKIDSREIFEYGMQFVIDGNDPELIGEILSNIIEQEKDEYTRIYKTIQKKAVLAIQSGINPRMLFYILNSCTDLPLKDDPSAEEALKDL